MDIKKEAKNKKKIKPSLLVLLVATVIVVGIILVKTTKSSVALERKGLILSTVRSGALEISVDGFGVVRSDELRLLTAPSNTIVKEIFIKPGKLVSAGDVIAVLENPEVKQELQSAQQELSKAQADLRQTVANNDLQQLNEEEILSETQANYQQAVFRLDAESSLIEKGIVSQLAYMDTKAEVARLKTKLAFLKKKQKKLKNIHAEMMSIKKDLVSQAQGALELAKHKADQLSVKAEFAGVLQRLSIEVGQSLTAGQEIATVGSANDLVAFVRIPQDKAQKIKTGFKAIIDNRQDTVEGIVTRIDPVVVENTVELEVALPKQLPSSLKAEQNIDSKIIIKKLANALFLERPAKGSENSKLKIFQMTDDNSSAELVTIQLGEFADQFVEIKHGAKAGQKFIISDLSNLMSSESSITIE